MQTGPRYQVSDKPGTEPINPCLQADMLNHQGPVVQKFVSETLSLSPQFVNYIST